MGKKLDTALGVLNAVVGDYLARTGNGLATELSFVRDGEPLPVERAALARAYPAATKRVVVLLHGLGNTESAFELAGGGDYGSMLAEDLGFTPLYVRYNSGLSIPDNGAAFARLLERFVDAYPAPIEEILPLGYSMGGLVVRSACHEAVAARHRWLPLVRRAIYVGTPHRGSPIERGGRVLARVLESIPDPYVRLVADIANLRSDGVKDLGDAELRHEDRARRRPTLSLTDPAHPVPLLPGIRHYLIAGTLVGEPLVADLFGDAVVPLASATGGEARGSAALPPEHIKVLAGIDHVSIAHHPDVYPHVRAFAEGPA